MKSFFGCPYDRKKGRPYFYTRERFGRPADIILVWFAYTPTHRISKYLHTLRLNADYYGEVSDEQLEQIITKICICFPKLRKGYTWSEAYRYS